MASRVLVYIACSLDGFIAGPDDDLSWLPGSDGVAPELTGDGVGYEEFTAGIGTMLMGRRTYETVAGFGGEWPYGDMPVLVATHHPLENAPASVRAVEGSIGEVIAAARENAADKDVYLDGGNMIRQALDAGLVDELIVTVVSAVLGEGLSLFAGTEQRHRLQLVDTCHYGSGMVQLRLRPEGR